MIVKMDKYSIMLLSRDLSTFLERLQTLGVIDITREEKAIDTVSVEIVNKIKRYKELIRLLKTENRIETIEDKLDNSIEPELVQFSPAESSTDELADRLDQIFAAISDGDMAVKLSHKEIEEATDWGDFDKNDIEKIEKLGFEIKYFAVSEKSFDENWNNQYYLKILNQTKGKIYFVILNPVGSEFKFKFPESKFPDKSFIQLEQERELLQHRLNRYKSFISKQREIALERLEKMVISESNNLELHLANLSSKKEVEEKLSILTGFAPINNRSEIHAMLQESSDTYYISEEAIKEDNPPIKLKNNIFAKKFEVIGELYMMPKYGTLDLTPFFAPFYMLFFGMCLGDLGYGIVLLVAGTLSKIKFKEYRQYLSLIQFLGIGSIIMPMMSGTFFGAKLYDLFPIFEGAKGLFLTDIQIFWFAILFGVFQIIVARIIQSIYKCLTMGWKHGLSGFGWVILITLVTLLYAGTMVKGLVIPETAIYISLTISGICILFFTSVEGNIFARFGKGLASLYDITGVFGDVLSYIRLFGLGLAGGILGLVVNSVAMIFSGVSYVGWFFTLIILLIGHSAVLLLSSLGAFVHPMRLTFVEFYKNAEFNGGGKIYRPLKKE